MKKLTKKPKFNIAVLGVRKSIFRGKVVVIQIYAIRFIATLERNKNAHFIICTKRNIDYNIKLRPKRGKHLPHIWDDKPTYAFKYAKSWKHNSKRRHQWYREKDGFREKMQSDYILTD